MIGCAALQGPLALPYRVRLRCPTGSACAALQGPLALSGLFTDTDHLNQIV